MSRNANKPLKNYNNHLEFSQLNKSKSKQTYSFSKSERFLNHKPLCSQITYQFSILSQIKKGSRISKQKKWDISKSSVLSPSPFNYYIKSKFQDSNKKGFSFSCQRQKVKFNSYIDQQKTKIPSCQKYHVNIQPIKARTPKFSMRRKTSLSDKSISIDKKNNFPGPGAYHANPELSASQKIISKFKNLDCGTGKSQRFNSRLEVNNTPGPGRYQPFQSFKKNPSFFNSKYKSGAKAKFSKSQRVSQQFERGTKISFQPGPGAYRLPSQFGYYDQRKLLSRSKQKFC